MKTTKWEVVIRTLGGFETSQTYDTYEEAKAAEGRALRTAEVGYAEVRRA